MLVPQHLLSALWRSPVNLFRCLVLPLVLQHQREVVQAPRGRVGAWRRTPINIGLCRRNVLSLLTLRVPIDSRS
jgi:hypothetical protein